MPTSSYCNRTAHGAATVVADLGERLAEAAGHQQSNIGRVVQLQ